MQLWTHLIIIEIPSEITPSDLTLCIAAQYTDRMSYNEYIKTSLSGVLDFI